MTEEQAEEIKRAYNEAQEVPCTCYSDPERSCRHCGRWIKAEKLVDTSVEQNQ